MLRQWPDHILRTKGDSFRNTVLILNVYGLESDQGNRVILTDTLYLGLEVAGINSD